MMAEERGFGAVCSTSSSNAGKAKAKDGEEEEDMLNNSGFFASMMTRKKKKYLAIALALMSVSAISYKAGYASSSSEQQIETNLSLPVDPFQTNNWRTDLETNNWDYKEQMQDMQKWKHPPANGGDKFTVCFKEGEKFNFFGAYNFINGGLKKAGMCVKNVKVSADMDDPSCDVSESTRAGGEAEDEPEAGGYFFHARKSVRVFARDEGRKFPKVVRLRRGLRENERVVVPVRGSRV